MDLRLDPNTSKFIQPSSSQQSIAFIYTHHCKEGASQFTLLWKFSLTLSHVSWKAPGEAKHQALDSKSMFNIFLWKHNSWQTRIGQCKLQNIWHNKDLEQAQENPNSWAQRVWSIDSTDWDKYGNNLSNSYEVTKGSGDQQSSTPEK